MPQSIEMMNVDQVRAFMDSHKTEEYTLLDVRQEGEYEDRHLPGASLVPLTELPDRTDEVPTDKPVVVYCASGGRSMAASTLLEWHGKKEIINMVGGMNAWEGQTAFGPMELGMVAFSDADTPMEVVRKAYAMENGLQEFYFQRADLAETEERIELFMELAGFEDRHKDVLFELHSRLAGDSPDRAAFDSEASGLSGDLVEGGVAIVEFLGEYGEAFDGDHGILQFAVMIEAQAMDFYLRCAAREDDAAMKDVLNLLAREEKAHLRLLGKRMDRLGAAG